jgi:hypothetical protein
MKIIKNFCGVILPIFLLLLMGCSMDPTINHAPDIDSIPIIYAFEGVLYTYDVEATDVDGDTLVYSLASSPTGMTINSFSGVISWTPSTAGDYDVTIEVSDGDLFETQSFTIAVAITAELSPPTGVEASDLLYDRIEITWNFVAGATHYRVYRANSLTGAKTAISEWQTGTSYDDTSVTPWTIYYYWVKAATNSSGDDASGFSAYDIGIADSPIPINLSPPYNVSASDLLVNKVQITWNTGQYLPIPTEATHYQVYRADNLLATKTAISDWQTGTSYNDTSVAPWTTYWYWVKAATSSSGDNASDFSSSDTGYAFSIAPL